jgi:hypothetical protein
MGTDGGPYRTFCDRIAGEFPIDYPRLNSIPPPRKAAPTFENLDFRRQSQKAVAVERETQVAQATWIPIRTTRYGHAGVSRP